jgi:hypothetical protein
MISNAGTLQGLRADEWVLTIRSGSRHAVMGAVRTKRMLAGVGGMPRTRGFAGHATEIVITEGGKSNQLRKWRLSACGYGAYMLLTVGFARALPF